MSLGTADTRVRVSLPLWVSPVLLSLLFFFAFGDGEEDARGDTFGRRFDLSEIRKRRRDADGLVERIDAVRMRGTGGREGDTCFAGEGDDAFGAALGHVERDKIAAFRMSPRNAWSLGEALLKDVEDLLKFRREDGAVAVHQFFDTGVIAQQLDVAELVDLIGTDGAGREAG